MQKELTLEGENGLELVGMTAGNTRFGSKEMVSILKRPVRKVPTISHTKGLLVLEGEIA